METTKNISEETNIDSLNKTVRKNYPILEEISTQLECTENEIKEMVHAFYDRKKANIEVGEEKGKQLNSKFIQLWKDKKRLEQLEFQEKAKTPEYQALFESLRLKKQNAQPDFRSYPFDF